VADFARKLVVWQRRHGRHGLPWQGTRDPYRIWLSEIMLQQTQVAAVVPYYERFLARFPDIASLARASEEEVLELWSGLGYYARGRNLRLAAREIARQGSFPDTTDEILALPGIGPSTAAAIAAFAFGRRAAILDGNVKRVLARYFGVEGEKAPMGARGKTAAGARNRGLYPGPHGPGRDRMHARQSGLRAMSRRRGLRRAARRPDPRTAGAAQEEAAADQEGDLAGPSAPGLGAARAAAKHGNLGRALGFS